MFGVIGLVAEREIRQRVRGRAFKAATLLILVGVAAAIVIPVAIKGKPHTQQVGVVGPVTPTLRATIAAAARGVDTTTNVVSEPDQGSAEAALRSKQIDVAVVGESRLLVRKSVSASDTGTGAQFVRALSQLLGVVQAERAANLSAEQAARLAQARALPVVGLEAAARPKTAARSTAVIGVIVLFLMLTQYLTWTLIGVMEEKSSRVVEVLLAAVRPLQLLSGKVLGIAAVVFTQAAVVAAFALVVAGAVGSDLLHGAAPLVLLATLVWLLLGYGFYSWLYAAAGSTAERQDQVQALAIPLGLPMIVGYILSITTAGTGSAAAYFKVLAYVPPTAPFAMTTLVGLGQVTWWQFTLSAAITAASAVGMARVAAAVYRRAILRSGKRVPLRDLVNRTG